jgi:peptidoglycan/LPS O-acetylase OafA/YrhL
VNEDHELLALTGLRFIAAFYVFLFHFQIRWPITDNIFIANVLGQGAVGMSLFFILSGFILAYRYADGRTSFGRYFGNRFARIYPVYVVAALLTLPWIGVTLEGGSLKDLAWGAAQGLMLIVTNILLIQAWFPQFFGYWNNGGSWSISVEAFCYVMLPLILPHMVRLPVNRLLLVALLCYFLSVLPGLIAILFPIDPRAVFYAMPIFRFPEFLLGSCVFLAFRGGWPGNLKQVYQWVSLVILVIYLGITGSLVPNYIGHNWIVIPFISFMILTLANGSSAMASFLATPVLVWLGKISYCFYSFQVLVILCSISYHDKIVEVLPMLGDNLLFTILALIILMCLSASGYYWLEEPARKKLRRIYAA